MIAPGTLLPPSRTSSEEAVELTVARIAVAEPVSDTLWDPQRVPAGLLPWLAWALSVDDWAADWTDDRKRRVLERSVRAHRLKGTLASVREALDVAGYPAADIIESYGASRYDGTILYDGGMTYESVDHWAEYRVVLKQPVTIAEGARIRASLERVAPARCRLKELTFETTPHPYDGSIFYDGVNSYGVT